jgi:hypothetical protein
MNHERAARLWVTDLVVALVRLVRSTWLARSAY